MNQAEETLSLSQQHLQCLFTVNKLTVIQATVAVQTVRNVDEYNAVISGEMFQPKFHGYTP